jgi:hypothetical protein
LPVLFVPQLYRAVDKMMQEHGLPGESIALVVPEVQVGVSDSAWAYQGRHRAAVVLTNKRLIDVPMGRFTLRPLGLDKHWPIAAVAVHVDAFRWFWGGTLTLGTGTNTYIQIKYVPGLRWSIKDLIFLLGHRELWTT